MVEPLSWLIRKGSLFYRANCQGYTSNKDEAGRYTEAKARAEAAVEPWHMAAVHESELPATELEVARATIAKLEADNASLKDLVAVSVGVGQGLVVYGDIQSIMRVQDYICLDSAHPVEREDVRRSLARALQIAEAVLATCERDTLERAAKIVQGLPILNGCYRTWPELGDGDQARDSRLVKFADALTAAIRAAKPSETGERG